MKRLILFLIPIVLVFIIVFGVIKIFILGDIGKGALQVTSHPLSKVYLNDKYIGNTPLCQCEASTMLRSGDYTIRVVPLEESLSEFQEKITITKGVLTVIDRKFGKGATSEGSIISLTPLEDKGASQLLVVSFPDKSDVYVDENQNNKTPVLVKNLTDSDHTLLLKHPGYKEKTVRIRTPVGYKLVASVYMALKDETNTPNTSPTPSASPSAATKQNGTPTPSPTIKASGKITILQTPNGFLRVRQAASINAAEIGRVSTGETYSILEENAGWYKIKLIDGTIGWISGQYASKL
jgi:hypothetical protein